MREKQGVSVQIFTRKSISRDITHPQSLNLIQIDKRTWCQRNRSPM